MKLFNKINRDDEGAAQYAEPKFIYLNRSARIEVEGIRQVLEEWFFHSPSGERVTLRSRFRSTNDKEFHSAFFELFLHELLIRLGCQVEIHPPSESTTKCPDFLVKSASGVCSYMEAVLATEESVEDAAARRRKQVVYDVLDKQLNSPDFFIGMKLRGTPETQPSAKKVATFLKKRLVSLNYDAIVELWKTGGINAVPQWYYEHKGWQIVFFPIPKPPNKRGKAGLRPLGVRAPLGGGWGRIESSRITLRDVITDKAGNYGKLNLPYVIAVNALGKITFLPEIHLEALFGGEKWVSIPDKTGRSSTPKFTRAPDGAWTSKSGPRYTRVSAVLLVNLLTPWDISNAPIRLYHNPWAQKLYTRLLQQYHLDL
jgi:hypothetical protein